jgi:serine/threonine-protein phosphatase 6 regulatory ankyrin repeat subunit B
MDDAERDAEQQRLWRAAAQRQVLEVPADFARRGILTDCFAVKLVHMLVWNDRAETLALFYPRHAHVLNSYSKWLRQAARYGSDAVIAALLKRKAQVNAPGANGRTALVRAVHYGQASTVALLLAAGANVHHRQRFGQTVLLDAVDLPDVPILQLLIAAKADVHRADAHGQTPVSRAADLCRASALQLLVDAKACFNAADRMDSAVTRGDWGELKRLIAAKTDVNGTGRCGHTYLARVASRGATRIVQMLVGAKAEVNGNDTCTPLARAAMHSHTATAKWLVGIKAELDKYDHALRIDPLSAALMTGQADLVQVLVAAKANLRAHQDDGSTFVGFAARMGQVSCVSVLVAANADVNTADYDGLTPLMEAAMQGHADAVRALLDAKANARATSSFDGQLALDYAVKCGHTSVVQVLRAHLGTQCAECAE